MKAHAAVFSAVALAGAALDLLTKTWVFAAVPYHGERVIIPGWFSFGHALNPGIVWSVGPGAKTLWLVLAVVAVPAIVAFFVFRKSRTWIGTLSLGMVLAGAIGNGIDRAVYGAVRDFIMAYYTRSDGSRAIWPLFNLADAFIVVGAILLALAPSPPAAKRSEAKA